MYLIPGSPVHNAVEGVKAVGRHIKHTGVRAAIGGASGAVLGALGASGMFVDPAGPQPSPGELPTVPQGMSEGAKLGAITLAALPYAVKGARAVRASFAPGKAPQAHSAVSSRQLRGK